jgi:hypothetical protein
MAELHIDAVLFLLFLLLSHICQRPNPRAARRFIADGTIPPTNNPRGPILHNRAKRLHCGLCSPAARGSSNRLFPLGRLAGAGSVLTCRCRHAAAAWASRDGMVSNLARGQRNIASFAPKQTRATGCVRRGDMGAVDGRMRAQFQREKL